MEPRPNLVVVTGGTGHVGAMVIDQLLKEGYSVRATTRPARVDSLKNTYPDANGKLEVVEMTDIVLDAGKWPEILKGADAVIHVASPVYHPGTTAEYIYTSANEGTQKLLDAVCQSSVKHFILTGSIGVFFNPDFSSIFDKTVYDHNTWFLIEDIDPKEHIPSYAYIASKITSEKLVWKAADKYPDIDFTAVHPSSVYGWFLKNYPVPKTIPEFNANKFVYQLIEKNVRFPEYPLTPAVHNRDVAKAHVRALTAPALPKGQRKRFIVSQGNMSWVDAIEFLKEPATVAKFKERGHDIVARLPDVSLAGVQSQFDLDASLTERVLGMKKEDYIPWQETLVEVMLAMMDWEKIHPEDASC
ncbi:NAD dependent epimerase/dehydratase [Mycena sanguinolenta]|uniref:NAD dependent epimerase/dehydratase n=1 Tax=Mycena sanguinolenta TaxID=230812 RepID=A0A8H6XY26_9AGAR|nr:NAD dependent epimerase/dehydratase [Mycena sanguinolenta]